MLGCLHLQHSPKSLSPRRLFHDGDFLRRQAVELVHPLVNLPLQRRRVHLRVAPMLTGSPSTHQV